jgi:peptide/nickel transport system substrate-binding protein
MDRRTVLRAAGLAVVGGLAAPRISRAADSRVLRFVPQANLANLDPIWGTQYVVRNAGLLIWDTLYGVDSTLTPKPQMAEGHVVEDDFKTWTIKLRPGLTFHDNTPVLARDAVASLKRWMARDQMGQLIAARLDALEAVDDRTLRFRLSKPFQRLPFALGKNNSPMAFIMPERIAATDPFKQIPDFIGSGPMKFARTEWVPGSQAAFDKFPTYLPRSEKADWLSGGKRINFDRIEWHILPDPATAAAALQNGEVDWWETPISDLVPLLKQNPDVRVDIADPLGNIGTFRINHLHPPFSDVRARRAILFAASQEDWMRATVGEGDTLWKPCPGFFTPGTALYTEDGGEPLKGPRRYDEAKKLLAQSGYNGDKVVMLVAQDQAVLKAQGDVSADMMTKIGINVDYVALDWGTVGSRRAKKEPPSQGGWNIFHSWHAGADCVNPAPYTALATTGEKAWFGWPKNDDITALIDTWYAAPDLAAEKAAAASINRASMEFVTYVPTGFFQGYQAWRKELSGVTKAPFPVFWDVKKA